MKKKIISLIIILVLIVLAVVAYFVVKNINEKNRDYQIEQITDYKYFVSKSNQNQKYGVIDTTGNVIIQEQYESIQIPNPSKDVFICVNQDGTKAYNSSAQEIYSEFGEIEALQLKNVSTDLIYEKSVLKYKSNDKYGLISVDGEKITEPIYEEIDTLQYKEGELLVKQNGKYGVINNKGHILVNIEYDQIQADTFYDETNLYRYDGYIVSNTTEEGYRYGYVSYNGKKILDTVYNDLKRLSEVGNRDEAYLLVAENGRYGVFKNDTQILENEYQSISFDANNEVFVVQKGKKYGINDISGKQVLDCKFEQIDVKGRNLYAKTEQNTVEVYTSQGELTNISEDTIFIDVPEKQGYMIRILTEGENTIYTLCKDEQPVTNENYQYISYLQNDLFIASKVGENLGIIDIQGSPKTEFKYSSIQLIPDTKLIQMTTQNNEIIEIADENAKSIVQMEKGVISNEKQYIKISNNIENKYILKDGKEISNKDLFSSNTLFAISKDGKWGFADKNDTVKIDTIYDNVTEFNEYGFAGVLKDGKWGIIKEDGTIILEPTYEFLAQIEPYFIGTYYQVKYGSGQTYYTK